MQQTTAIIGRDKYITSVQSGAGNNIISDEPVANGGQDSGFAPGELLAASLGACTCITLRMYADRKGWPMESVTVAVSYERSIEMRSSHFVKEITFHGPLDEEQKVRLTEIAGKCPVHVTLSNPITIATVVK